MSPPQELRVAIDPRDAHQTSIALFTDTHYWPNGGDYVGGEDNLQLLGDTPCILASLVDSVRHHAPDGAIHLGDLTCGGGTYSMTQTDFVDGLETVTRALQSLPVPAFALPGNHDCPPGGGNWSRFEALWGLAPGCGYTIDIPHARLLLINAQGHSAAQIEAAKPFDPVSGWINDHELMRVDRALAAAGDRPVLVFLHQLLRPWIGERAWAHYYGIDNADVLVELLARYGNVRVVFQGHAHMLDVHEAPLGAQPCRFVVVPSLIECPLNWLKLTITREAVSVRVVSLLLPELEARTCTSGPGQDWRRGEPAWHDMTIPLR